MHVEHQKDVAKCLNNSHSEVCGIRLFSMQTPWHTDLYHATNNSDHEVLFLHDLPRTGNFCDKIQNTLKELKKVTFHF
jgi:hypothetical protein